MQMDEEAITAEGEAEPNAVPAEYVETIARKLGWDPDKKLHNGSPGLSADEYLESFPSRQQTLANRLSTLERDHKGVVEHHTRALENTRKQAVQEAEAKFAKAVEEGDGETAAEAQREITEAQNVTAPQNAQPSQTMQSWLTENPWFHADPVLRQEAIDHDEVLRKRGGISEAELLSEVKRRVVAANPEKAEMLGVAEPKKPTPVEGAKPTVATKQGNAFADIEDEAAKQAFQNMFRMGAWKDKETGKPLSEDAARKLYAKEYFE